MGCGFPNPLQVWQSLRRRTEWRRKICERSLKAIPVETAIQGLSQPSLDDPTEEVRQAGNGAEQSLYCKLQLSGEEISLLKAAEEAGREQALEETRAYIAHEVRSAIGPLRIISQMLRDDLDRAGFKNGKAAEYIERILEQTDTAYHVIRRYVDYSRPLDPQLKPTELASLLADSLDEIHAECLSRNIEVAVNVEPGMQALMDRALMAEALRNVLQNAIEAMDAGGKLALSAGTGKNWVVLEINDTGRGLKPEHLRQAFELGFTTKLGAQGAGVGLALSRRIVHEAHGGQISLTNNQNGAGATLTIKLPANRETQNGSQETAAFDRR